jgi:DNA replication initiation complex subunit (GINS family)
MAEDTAQMALKEVALTYEKLYELLRREKNREELQLLDPAFFSQLVFYLTEKDRGYSDTNVKTDLFSISERDRLHSELQNIRRLVKELYERREKKIIEMGLNRSRTNSNIVDTTNLLPEERALFDNVVSTLDLFRHSILGNVLSLRNPLLSGTTSLSALLPAAPGSIATPASAHKRLRFLQSVEQVFGTEMEPYGPFAPNDTASIPREIAEVWIEQGAAVESAE